MALDPQTLDMIHESLDRYYSDTHGRPKPLRLFTAPDCRNYARNHTDVPMDEVADMIEEANLVLLGEAIARERALVGSGCARCAFEQSICEVVYSGTFIEQRYKDARWTSSGQPGARRLNDTERHLLKVCQEWMTDATIERCLEGE